MLEINRVETEIWRSVVERVFSERQNISERFEELVNSETFTRYKEKIFFMIQAEAEKEGINYSKLIVEEEFLYLLKISLYAEALNDISREGEGELISHLFEIIDMKKAKEYCLKWLTTKTGVNLLLQISIE